MAGIAICIGRDGVEIITSDRDGNHPAFSTGISLKPKRK